jgi:hypothetical protein
LPPAGIIVAQKAPLHAYYTMANEIQETNAKWQAARAQVTPQMANNLAEMASRYPDLPASVLTGAAATGIDPAMPALQSLNDRIAYERTIDPIGSTATNILSIPFDFVRGGVRIATTAFDAIYQELISRPVRIAVGMSQGMGFDEAFERSGSSAGTRALGRFFADPIGNLTPLPSRPEGQVNIGSGWLPGSNVADAQTAEVQMLMQSGVPEANAIAVVQQKYGDPVTELAYQQAQTGITFQSGLSISPGRLVAKGIGLEEGTMPFHIASGAADFGSQIFLDPTNLALWGLGKARLANKMLIGGGTRRKLFGVHVDDYLQSNDYRQMLETLAGLRINEDVANALNVNAMTGGVEGFSTRKLVGDVVEAKTPQEVDNVLRPYFGGSEAGGLPMFTQVPTPRSIMNPSGSRRTVGQILGGRFEGAAGDVGGTFGLKAAVQHNLEGHWMGRMFSQMPGNVIVTDNLDEGYHQFRAWLNSADFTPEESHVFLQEFSMLRNGDGPGADAVIKKAKKYFVDHKLGDDTPDAVKKRILKAWNRWETKRKYWTNQDGSTQWTPDIDIIGVVDDGEVVISKATAQMVNELYNNAIPMPGPREIRNALSREGVLKIGKYTSTAKKVKGTDTEQLVEQAWVNIIDGYMQKVWKPFVLMRVAWPVRVVFEEQLRMAAAGFDSMFSHPISWFAYAFGGKMNKTLMGDSLEVAARKGTFTRIIDFRPNGKLTEFEDALAKGAGPFLDGGGRSPGMVQYVNVWQHEEGFADTWLWNLAKNHQDPMQKYLRANGIDNTVDWLLTGEGKPFLRQLIETGSPVRKAFLGETVEQVTAPRLRWYVEGLHARSVQLQGGDYVYWNARVDSIIIDGKKGGWLSSGDIPLRQERLDELGLDPLGPPDPGPLPGRGFRDGGEGPTPTDGLPDPGQGPGPGPGSGPGGTDPFDFPSATARGGPEPFSTPTSFGSHVDVDEYVAEIHRAANEMVGPRRPGESMDEWRNRGAASNALHHVANRIEETRTPMTASDPNAQAVLDDIAQRMQGAASQAGDAAPPVSPPPQPRRAAYDTPFSESDAVARSTLNIDIPATAQTPYSPMGWMDSSTGYDPSSAFASLYNELNTQRKSDIAASLFDEAFSTTNRVLDDLYHMFNDGTGKIDDDRLTAAFNTWAATMLPNAEDARPVADAMVWLLNQRHQQQLDLLNYVYPGRLSVRSEALEALTDAKMWGGVKLLVDDLPPESVDELRFLHRFIDSLATNETSWGRDANKLVDFVFDNYGAEFASINRDSRIVRELAAIGASQRARRVIPLDQLEPRTFAEALKASIKGGKGSDQVVVKGFVPVDDAGNALTTRGIYTERGPGMAEASITIDNYITNDLTDIAVTHTQYGGNWRLEKTIQAINERGLTPEEARTALYEHLETFVLGRREFDRTYSTVVLQGPIDRTHPLLKGVSEDVLNTLDGLRGAHFRQIPGQIGEDLGVMPRIVVGGYDGVWSASERAAFVAAAQESGAFTDQGAMSIARVIEVLQKRDAGLTRGWLDVLGREIANVGASKQLPKPLDLMSLQELELTPTRDLMDELIQLAHGFDRRSVAANDAFKAVRPGAELEVGTGVEARLVDVVDELARRLNLAEQMGPDEWAKATDAFDDAIYAYAELNEVPAETIANIIEWLDNVTYDTPFVAYPSQALWPRHLLDDFDEMSQPHLFGNSEAFADLPDDAEVWVFHGTDMETARTMLIEGIDPVNKPIDKLREPGDIGPGRGYDPALFVTGSHEMALNYNYAAGGGINEIVVAVKVRKGDLRHSRDYLGEEVFDRSVAFNDRSVASALIGSPYGAVVDGAVPPGNVRIFSADFAARYTDEDRIRDLLDPDRAYRQSSYEMVKANVEASEHLPIDMWGGVQTLQRRGYRVEVIASSKETQPRVIVMDRDRIVEIELARKEGMIPTTHVDPETGRRTMGWIDPDTNEIVPLQDAPSMYGYRVTEWVPGSEGRVDEGFTNKFINEVISDVFGDDLANNPRRGFWYNKQMIYGSPRPKSPYRIHRDKGNLVNFEGLPIEGGAKLDLQRSIPDSPRPPEPGEPTPRPPLALGEGPPRPALGAGEPPPPGGYAATGGVNDPNFKGNYYVITKGPDDEVRKMVDTGVAPDPFTGEDMDLFPTGTIDNYADDIAGLPSRHMVLNDYLDSAPQVLPGPNPEFVNSKQGLWDQVIETMFYYMMSVPTNKLSRAPVFKQAYIERLLHLRSFGDDATKARVDKALQNDLGLSPRDLRRRNPVPDEFFSRGEAGAGVKMSFREMDQVAKGYALETTRGLLYDMSRKHDASDVLRNIFPFAEAWGEIITRWSKIMWENPRTFRRAQQGIEGAREQGWFYNDSYGQEVFAYPGSGFVTKAMLGLGGEDTDVRFTGTTAGVNLALGQYVPGFGPMVQVPVSMLLPNMPKFDSVRKFLMPYGDEEVRSPGDILNLALPAWVDKALIAIGTGDGNYRRLHGNTVMDTYKILAAEHPERMNDAASSYALMEEASRKASGLLWVRVFASFISPTSPQIEYRVEDTEGTMWQMQTMASEYYRLLRQNDFDQQVALTSFIQRFGWGETLTEGLGMASTFITPKSVQVEERSTSDTGFAWQRENADLFAPGAYPGTAAYAMQDVDWDEFDYNAYLDGLKTGAREALTPQQWLQKRNELLGNIAYDVAAAKVQGRTDRAARLWKRDMRIKLRREYPGFDVPIPGMPERVGNDTQIMELERWSTEPRLAESNAGQGVAVYLQLRRRAEAEAYNRGLMPDSWKSATMMESWRNWLRASADEIIRVFPEFGQLWFDVFRWELTEDETPEVLALGGMTF